MLTVVILAEPGPPNVREEGVSTPKPSADDTAGDFPLQESGRNGENNFLSLMLNGERVKYGSFIHNP